MIRVLLRVSFIFCAFVARSLLPSLQLVLGAPVRLDRGLSLPMRSANGVGSRREPQHWLPETLSTRLEAVHLGFGVSSRLRLIIPFSGT